MRSLYFSTVCAVLFVLNLFVQAQTAKANPPNIILFYVDDLGWKDTGYMGSDFYETPHIDRLADAGMKFTNAYANAPNCAPSRASLMTGLYTPRHGIFTVGDPARGNHPYRKLIPIPNKRVLDTRFITIAKQLKAAGYQTAVMGKWHLGNNTKEHGFDVNIAANSTGSPRGGYFSPYKNPQLTDGPQGEFLTDRLTDEAITFIQQNKQNPFLLYLAHYAVHTPLQAPSKMIDRFTRKQPGKRHKHPTYAAMIKAIDISLGKILKSLDEHQLAEQTVVWFYSDNGGYRPATSMAPLRGSKGMLYEGGIRVPMAVRWSGKISAGSQCNTPVIGTDLYPTFLELAGRTIPQNLVLDGESLLPLLLQQRSINRKAIFWHFPAYLQNYRGFDGPFRTTPAGAIRLGDYKLIEFFEEGRLELYNLKSDIAESKNLIQIEPEKTKELHDLLIAWRREIHAPVPSRLNPMYNPNAGQKKN